MPSCKHCGHNVVWVTNGTTGKKIMLDPSPIEFNTPLVTARSCFVVLEGQAFYVHPFSGAIAGYKYFKAHAAVCTARSAWDRSVSGGKNVVS